MGGHHKLSHKTCGWYHKTHGWDITHSLTKRVGGNTTHRYPEFKPFVMQLTVIGNSNPGNWPNETQTGKGTPNPAGTSTPCDTIDNSNPGRVGSYPQTSP